MRALCVFVVAGLAGCGQQRGLTLSPAFPSPCGDLSLNELRVAGIGDFAPAASNLASALVSGDLAPQLSLELPRNTRVVTVQGDGANGVAAIGRSAPFELASLWNGGGQLSIAFGPANAFCPTAALATPRAAHVASLLADGSVLVAGGVGTDGGAVESLERYLPSGDHDSPVAHFTPVDGSIDPTSALGATATTLADGRVLLAGGAPASAGVADGIAYGGAQLLDSRGVPDGAPRVLDGGARAFHSAVLLGDGRVLLAGGCSELTQGACSAAHVLPTATIYDPDGDRFTSAPALASARWGHDAIVRSDGLVLLVGGRGADGSAQEPEVYDPTQTRGFQLTGPAGQAVGLDSGLIVGQNDAAGPTALTLAWSGTGNDVATLPQLPSARASGTVTALEDGTVLFAGGWDGTSLADRSAILAGDGVTSIMLDGFHARGHSATRLLDGTVLLVGGFDASGAAQGGASIFLRSLTGPFDSPATLGFDSPTPILPARPSRAAIIDGALAVDGATGVSVPTDFAVLAGPQLAGPSASGFSIDVLTTVQPGAQAAILYGSMATSQFVAVTFAAGQVPMVQKVSPSQPGLVNVSAQSGCKGQPVTDDDLAANASVTLVARNGVVELKTSRTVLHCKADGWPTRGEIALGAIGGNVRYDNVTLTR